MSLFAISDLHLSLGQNTDKSMDVFGKRWQDYTQKLNKCWRSVVTEEDTVVIPGDISWALTLEEAEDDLRFIHELPGKKIIGKGNHDFWWQTMKKLTTFTEEKGFSSLSFLHNNAIETAHHVICGTRGWFYDPSGDNIPKDTDFEKISTREAMRLAMSLTEGERVASQTGKELVTFLHFPAVWMGKVSEGILQVLKEHHVQKCYFGHIHSGYDLPMEFSHEDVAFSLSSADFL
ncbi:MAG: metallophosphoesterase, partial [Clostridia bacterium]|nr:metallophosphoesterase [Clostridia bacterium]